GLQLRAAHRGERPRERPLGEARGRPARRRPVLVPAEPARAGLDGDQRPGVPGESPPGHVGNGRGPLRPEGPADRLLRGPAATGGTRPARRPPGLEPALPGGEARPRAILARALALDASLHGGPPRR